MMLRMILFFYAFIFWGSSDLLASSLPLIKTQISNKSFLNHWERSPIYKQSQNNEVAHFQTMVRHSTQGNDQYVIGSVSMMQIPKRLAFDHQEMLTSLRMGYDTEHWTYQKQGRLHLYEAHWIKGNRIVRLAIHEGKNHIKAITSLYRLGYRDVVAPEAYLIENALLRDDKTTALTPSPSHLMSLLLSSSWAQSGIPTGFSGLESILDSISPSTDLGPQSPLVPGSVGSDGSPLSIGGINHSLDISGDVDVSGQVDVGLDDRTSGQVDDIQAQITRTNDEIAATRTTLDQQMTRTNDEIASTRDMVDRNWSETNKQAARANRTAEKLTDPKHMFLLSGATAAGAVVGGFVANMAIQGLITGVDWMIEQMTGTKAAAERWRQFQEARRQWETTLDQALTLERSIDQFLLFHETLQTIRERLPESERSKLTIEGIIRHFNIEILMKQREKRALEELFQNERNPQCSLELADKIAEINDLTTNMSSVVSILGDHKKDNPDTNIFDDRYFCSQMDHMMRNLLDAESALQRYRLHMINGQAEWRKDLAENVEDLQDVSGRLQTGGDDILDRSIKSSQDLYSTNYDSMRDRLKRECRAQGLLFTGGCVSEKLEGANAQEARDLELARDQAIEEARKSAERRLQRPVTVNTNIEYDRLRAYQDWFEELEDQQYCNQRPDDPRCLELAQFRHNGVFYVKNRSITKIQDLCQPQRTTLAQIEDAQERARAIDREPASMTGANYSVATGTAEAPQNYVFEEAERPGFFNRLFQGVANFFRSIGEFFGFASPRQPVGEQRSPSPTPASETYVSYDQPVIMDSPRLVEDEIESFDYIEEEQTPIVEPEIEEAQYERIPASLNEKVSLALEHPIFEDEIVGEQFLADLANMAQFNPEDLVTAEQLLDKLSQEKDATETPISDSYEMILDRPRLNPHQKSALLFELAWSDQEKYQQAVRLMDQPEIAISFDGEALSQELKNLIDTIPALRLDGNKVILSINSLSSEQLTMNLYQSIIILNREDSMERKIQLLRDLIDLL